MIIFTRDPQDPQKPQEPQEPRGPRPAVCVNGPWSFCGPERSRVSLGLASRVSLADDAVVVLEGGGGW